MGQALPLKGLDSQPSDPDPLLTTGARRSIWNRSVKVSRTRRFPEPEGKRKVHARSLLASLVVALLMERREKCGRYDLKY